jgi:hypothetical protein
VGKFIGADIHNEFLQITGIRLRDSAGLAEIQFPDTTPPSVELLHQNFIENPEVVGSATHVVMNPPFSMMEAPVTERWASGTVNSAAVFVKLALDSMPPGSRLLAILPDVLRSGSRYGKWREQVEKLISRASIESLGLFDSHADVHVFILDVIKFGASCGPLKRVPWQPVALHAGKVIADLFDVKVGSVVPHRHKDEGLLAKYLTARTMATSTDKLALRGHAGRLDKGPMVVIGRTSRPGQAPRVNSRIIRDKIDFAVENHLIVLLPKSGKIEECEKLDVLLKSSTTASFLDDFIKCRHLTVAAVRQIPWTEE